MNQLYTLSDASELTPLSLSTLRKRAERGTLPTIKKNGVHYITEETLHKLLGNKPTKKDFDSLYQRWLEDMASGIHTGKPIDPKTIQNAEYSFRRYFKETGLPKELLSISPENIRSCFSKIGVDHQKEKCFHSIKMLIYNSFTSFYKLLIAEGVKPATDLLELKKIKPMRFYPPRRTVLNSQKLDDLLARNASTSYRTEFDVALGNLIIGLATYAGLRRGEIIKLRSQDVDLKEQEIFVYHGKGKKNRIVGIKSELLKILEEWEPYRKKIGSSWYVCMANGNQITESAIRHRIKRLSNKTGLEKIDITPHGLRRTCANQLQEQQAPIDFIRETLGHSSLEITKEYLMTTQKQAADWLKKH